MVNALVELLTFATAWYNLPFTLALLAFLGLSALQFLGFDHGHDSDADVHVDLDHDVGLDHDLDLDHDFDIDHDLDLDHDLDVDHDADFDHNLDHDVGHDAEGLPAWAGVLEFLGVGRAPVTLVLLVLLGGFGLLGWIINALMVDRFSGYPHWGAFVAVLGVALLGSIGLTSRTARLINRLVPAFASTATSVTRLVGRRGYVTSAQVDATYGQVKVRDSGGTLLTVFAVVDPNKPALARDTEVYLVEYDADKKVFVVVPSE